MIAWAESPGAHPLVLAMGEPRRQHVQAKFTDAGVPLSAQTLKQGSPHKLVLGKPRDLHERERGLREQWARDLVQLEGGAEPGRIDSNGFSWTCDVMSHVAWRAKRMRHD
ncbi:MAG: hypothetical protein L6Q75_04125 [Burkholderiaceae bacterium]|nr:hypothetical protein [Burkholderiaceae bacterium]